MLHMRDQAIKFIDWTNPGRIHRENCLNFSCPGRPSQMRNVFIWGDFPSNNTTQNQPKPTTKLMQTSWFRQILQFTCDACTLFGPFLYMFLCCWVASTSSWTDDDYHTYHYHTSIGLGGWGFCHSMVYCCAKVLYPTVVYCRVVHLHL